MPDFHGIQSVEVNDGTRTITLAATSIIGLVATGPAADPEAFPLDKAVRITDVEAAIGKAGVTGTLQLALRAIANQAHPVVVAVRVAPGVDAAATNANVIGTTNAQGQKTGMQALLAAEAQLGIKPRIIGAPGLDTQAVTTAMIVVAKKLRAMIYAAAIGATVEDAITYAAQFSARELMLLWPNAKMTNEAGATVVCPAPALAMGLRSAIDRDSGFWKTLSNVAVQGVLGLEKDIQWDITNLDTEAGLLNAGGITAMVNANGGYRFWGNRTRSDDPLFAFESTTRTAQVLLDTIGAGLLWAIDKPLKPSLAKSIVESINATFRQMKSADAIIGANSWYDPTRNSPDTLSAGKLWIDYDYTPVPPLEQLMLTQRITDTYFADFATGLQ
ncbi:MAG TPA: phage tail sheath C-terminal domain-containing protein [Sphingobium sp.]|uniref:phage tail sheath C-terminal domain-containing protein n=1 Tax=Sphingobium sp. TaxID=1912891 RepID=UPI002ECFBFEE